MVRGGLGGAEIGIRGGGELAEKRPSVDGVPTGRAVRDRFVHCCLCAFAQFSCIIFS